MKFHIGLFLLRITVGFTFLFHGLDKFVPGIEETVEYFSSLGLPGFTAYLVAFVEIVGGLLMILGAATRVVAVLFAFIMIGAIFFANLPEGFLGGYELDLILLVVSIHLLLSGSRFLAVDAIFSKRRRR